MNTSEGRPIEILLVEDSPSDTELTLESLKDFIEVLRSIEAFWLFVVALPPAPQTGG